MRLAVNVSACIIYIITYYAKLFLAPASRVPANIVFLVLLMFLIFEHPIRIRFPNAFGIGSNKVLLGTE